MKIFKAYCDLLEYMPGDLIFMARDFYLSKLLDSDIELTDGMTGPHYNKIAVVLTRNDMMLVVSRYIHCNCLYLYVMSDNVMGWCSFNIKFLTGAK